MGVKDARMAQMEQIHGVSRNGMSKQNTLYLN